jgi:hypothetical protein
MIRFSYRPTFKDFQALNRHAMWHHLRLGIILAGLLSAVCIIHPFAVYFLHKGQGVPAEVEFGLMNIVIPPVIVLFFFSMKRAVRKRWDTVEALRAEVEYQFQEEGLLTLSGQNRNLTEWRQFESVKRTGEHFFLRVAGGAFHYFAVSAVPDPDGLSAFLAGKIPVKKS